MKWPRWPAKFENSGTKSCKHEIEEGGCGFSICWRVVSHPDRYSNVDHWPLLQTCINHVRTAASVNRLNSSKPAAGSCNLLTHLENKCSEK